MASIAPTDQQGALREQEKLERRAAIMDAAERVFLARGVGNATMDQIAKAVRLSKGTLYLYFKNKGDLYLAIATRALRELNDRWRAVKDSGAYENGFELYKMLLEAYLEYALGHRDRFRVTLGWSSAEYSVPKGSEAFAEYQQMVEASSAYGYEALELGKRDGSVRPDLDSLSTSFHVWGGTVGMLMLIYAADETRQRVPFPVDLNQSLLDHVSVLLTGLRHPIDERADPVRLRRLFGNEPTDSDSK